jgi:hypothetical protein
MPSILLKKKLASKHQEVRWSHGSCMAVDDTKWSECLLHINVGKMDEHPSIAPDITSTPGNNFVFPLEKKPAGSIVARLSFP